MYCMKLTGCLTENSGDLQCLYSKIFRDLQTIEESGLCVSSVKPQMSTSPKVQSLQLHYMVIKETYLLSL